MAFRPFSLAPPNRSPLGPTAGASGFFTKPGGGAFEQLDLSSIGGGGGFQTFAQNKLGKNIARGGTPGQQPTALPGFSAVAPQGQSLSPATLQFLQSQGLLNPAEASNLGRAPQQSPEAAQNFLANRPEGFDTRRGDDVLKSTGGRLPGVPSPPTSVAQSQPTDIEGGLNSVRSFTPEQQEAARAFFGNRTGGDPFQRPANDPFNPFSGRPPRIPPQPAPQPQPGAGPAPVPQPGGGPAPAPVPPPQGGGGFPEFFPPVLAPNSGFRPLPVGTPPGQTPLPQDPSGLSRLNPLRADQAAQEGVFADPNLIGQSPAFSQFGNLFGGSLNTFDPTQDPFAAGRNSTLFNLLGGPFAGDPFGLPGQPTAALAGANFQLASANQREREIQDARNQLQFGQQQLLNDPGLLLGRGVADFLGRDPFTTSSDALQREEEGLLTRRINTAAQGALGTASDRAASLGLAGGESSLVRAGVDFGGRAALADALAQSRIGQSQRRAQDLQSALSAGQTVSNQALSNIFGPAATRAQFEGSLFRPEQQQFIRDMFGFGNVQIAEELGERAKGADIGRVLQGLGAAASVVGNLGGGAGPQGFGLF